MYWKKGTKFKTWNYILSGVMCCSGGTELGKLQVWLLKKAINISYALWRLKNCSPYMSMVEDITLVGLLIIPHKASNNFLFD